MKKRLWSFGGRKLTASSSTTTTTPHLRLLSRLHLCPFQETKLCIAALWRLRIHFHFDYEVEYFSGLHQPRDPLFLITDDGRCFTFGNEMKKKINQASLFSFPQSVKPLWVWSCHLLTTAECSTFKCYWKKKTFRGKWTWNSPVSLPAAVINITSYCNSMKPDWDQSIHSWCHHLFVFYCSSNRCPTVRT